MELYLAYERIDVVLYRLFLHPLARFPGPKLAAVTRWYEGYYDVIQNGQYTFKIAEMHKKYGPIIRISPWELHVSDSAFFNTLYCQEGPEGPTIHTVDHERHKARRKPLAPFFSKMKVASSQDMIQLRVARLCDRISDISKSGGKVNLGAAVTAMARDVAMEFILGKTYNSLDSEDFNVAFIHAAQGAGPLWRITKHVGYVFHILNAIPLDWAMKISDDEMKTFFSHMKLPESHETQWISWPPRLLHEILESKLPTHDKSFQRVFEDVTSLSGAGCETIGNTLRLIIFHVFSNPEILQRLRAEINSAKAENINVEKLESLEKLPYLTSVIMEGLRLSPGIATRMARIAPDRDLFYKEWRIPAGTPVGMTTILMHTDEQLYPEPLSFDPDRWMDRNDRRNADKAYAPFSKGTRMCLGMYLAWAEIYLVLAALVQRFNFQFEDSKAEDFECESDQFTIGTNGKGLLKARISILKG
ncbi:cytochrome P450 [Annulohypoxylon nitens]|nr:cytochrome P450 [Annulohypoxylon nitens]